VDRPAYRNCVVCRGPRHLRGGASWRIEAYDTEAMLSVTKNLVDHGSLTTVGSGWVLGPVSTPYAPYGIGVSILAVLRISSRR